MRLRLCLCLLMSALLLPRSIHAEDETAQRLARLEKLVQEQAAVIEKLQKGEYSEADISPQPRETTARQAALNSALLDNRIDNLHFAVRATSVVQGTVNGDDAGLRHDIDRGQDDTTNGVNDDTHDKADANIAFGLEIQAPAGDRGLAYLMLEGGHGDGLAENLPTWVGTNETLESEDIMVTQLYYQHSFLDEELIIRAGMLDPSTLFDCNAYANNGDTQFLSNGLVNAHNVDWPDRRRGYGLDLSWAPTAAISASIGIYDGDGDWDAISRDVFAIAEIGFHPLLNGTHPGHYRMYTWSNNDNQRRTWLDDDDELGWGVGISFDQEISNALGVFARYSYADENQYEVAQTWSAGLAFFGRTWGREQDMLGMAIGQSYLSGEYRRTLAAGFDAAPETFFELFYRCRINDVLAVTPDIQLVRNAMCDRKAETVGIFGMRAQLDF